MAMLLSKTYFSFQIKRCFQRQQFSGVYTWYNGIEWKCRKRILRNVLSVLVGASATCGAFLYFLDRSVQAMGREAHPPSYPWDFEGYLTSLDHSGIRRGWQVYRTICSTCHSLRYVRFMDLIDVSHTRDEIKAIAAEYEIQDGPDEEGNYYMRPGKLSDLLPPPFPNEEAAKAANFGVYPPDLTYIILARSNGRNYVFSFLTGWKEPPAGISLSDHQYFNIYFPGNVLNMPQNHVQLLVEGVVEYDDGTPSTTSQMAKDLITFLSWTSAQEFDQRKQMFIKGMGISIILIASIAHYSRFLWSHVRSRQIAYIPKEKY
ncbi:CY1 protein, partial [Pseudoatta argentina]